MKVIKRDGRIVDYDRSKVITAIEKANREVRKNEQANKEDIKVITEYIEEIDKKRILVEDIQDIIEQKLMELRKYELAKKYIVYRYTRALVRKSNTTDESILGLIRNSNKNNISKKNNKNMAIASTQRNLIAGEVSKDLTWRMLLPEKISNAEKEGKLHFHDADYFIQPIFNSCLVNLQDMLDNGTVINGKIIETPKSFLVACTIVTQIITSVSSNQYGEQSINIKHLGKYLRKSREKIFKQIKEELEEKVDEEIIKKLVNNMLKKELHAGVQTLYYQINTSITIKGQEPDVSWLIYLDLNDEYVEENEMIIEEILKQTYDGIKNYEGINETPKSPKIIYVLDEVNCLKGGKYDYLTELAIKCTLKRRNLKYISSKKMKELYEGNVYSTMGYENFILPKKNENGEYKLKGRFNQGVVSINLPQIGIIAEGNEEIFWKELNERLELCKEALLCRHYALLGTNSDFSPINWINGAISRLKSGEKIDKLLYDGYSTLSLGYTGIYEVTKIMTGESHVTVKGREFAIKIMKELNTTVTKWKKENNIEFVVYGITSRKLGRHFLRIDKEKFGTIKDITDKEQYTNSFHVDLQENINNMEKLKIECEYQDLSKGGSLLSIEIPEMNNNLKDIEEFIKYMYDNVLCTEFKIKEE